ncbi:MAG: FecR domain-containing protein [Bdellovibrio sp.]|nr:FecR domain-containing protein [Bdellovibrio sp.]
MKCIIFVFLHLILLNMSVIFAQDAFFRHVRPPVVILSPDGQEEVASKESVTAVGESIQVKEGGLAIIELEDRSIVKIEAGSELLIEDLIKEENEDTYVGASSMVLKMGSIFVEVAQKFSDAPSLNIKNTKSVALGVRGTELFAGIDDDNGDFYTSVKSGEVEVYDVAMDDSDSIKAGESMVVEQGKKITRPANFEWAKRLRWNSGEDGGSDFRNLRRQARQEFLGQANTLRNRQRRPVAARFNQWQARRTERRRPQERLNHLLERRQWKERPSELKQNRRGMMEGRRQQRQERRKDRIGNGQQHRPGVQGNRPLRGQGQRKRR